MAPVQPYDVRVAKQVALLTKLRLSYHISRKGGVMFKPARPWWDRSPHAPNSARKER